MIENSPLRSLNSDFILLSLCIAESAGLTLEETGTLFVDGFGVKKADLIRKAKRSKKDLEASGVNDMADLSS